MEEPIVELARRSVRTERPGTSLAAIAELRIKLAELEKQQVANAVTEGWSWTAIAQGLGMSKQAAHKKHSRFVKEAGVKSQTKSERLVIAGQARAAIRAAGILARERGNPQVGPAHILLGLLETESLASDELLAEAGVTRGSVREELNRMLGSAVNTGADQPDSPGAVPLSALGRAILEASLREALKTGSSRLEADHVLLALLRLERGSGAELLARLEVDVPQLSSALEAAIRRD